MMTNERKIWEAAMLLVRRSAMFPVVIAPPLVYSLASASMLYVRSSGLKDRKVLIIAGERDDIVPPKMARALWKATGEQKIVWYDCTHYGAAAYFVPALEHVIKHFTAE